MKTGVDLREAARRTARLDINARYDGLSTLVLMENAGRGVADTILAWYGAGKRIAIFCGLGNNGGDGLVVARHLMDRAEVTLFLLGTPKEIATAEARANWAVLERTAIPRIFLRDSSDVAACDLRPFELIVDALLGTGSAGEPREPCRSVVQKINTSQATRVAIDVPTGYGSAVSVNADLTLSFHFPKTPDAEVLTLGVPSDLEARLGPGDICILGRLPRDAHKGQGGRTLIVGGSAFFRGALEYAARAAAQIVDLVYHASPRPCEAAVSRIPDLLGTCLDGDFLSGSHLDEIVSRVEACQCDSVLVGPGLGLGPGRGVHDDTRDLVVRLIPALAGYKVVVDADGLNAIDHHLEVLGPHVALTPHAGEFRRLAGVDPTPQNVTAFARTHRCTVVVKGPVDIVSDGEITRFGHTGNPGMTTGGTGDVLSGALAAFAARHSLFEAACAATFATGLAGDFVKKDRGEHFTATDVAARLGEAIRWAEQF